MFTLSLVPVSLFWQTETISTPFARSSGAFPSPPEFSGLTSFSRAFSESFFYHLYVTITEVSLVTERRRQATRCSSCFRVVSVWMWRHSKHKQFYEQTFLSPQINNLFSTASTSLHCPGWTLGVKFGGKAPTRTSGIFVSCYFFGFFMFYAFEFSIYRPFFLCQVNLPLFCFAKGKWSCPAHLW